ncbi:MAG: helix-turn-helix domain-containing protein [Nitriliruptorales bacterium]|nr:helix-turn-helix domain-containing protein [Nitriliruptorales bacterium]
MDPPSDLIQSVSRALRILEVVGAAPHGLSPKAVARRCGLKLSTTYHLLRTLGYEGYLFRRDDGDYVLGLEIADRFRELHVALSRPPKVEAVLRAIAQNTTHTAYLARFAAGRITITEVMEAPQSPRVEDLIPGFDEGAHATALGKALLSTLPVKTRREYLADTGMRRFTSATIDEVDALEIELSHSRKGAFTEVAQYREGIACAALLVATGLADDPWWAIGLSAPVESFARHGDQLVAALRSGADDLAA